jgi:hypothetical protein
MYSKTRLVAARVGKLFITDRELSFKATAIGQSCCDSVWLGDRPSGAREVLTAIGR